MPGDVYSGIVFLCYIWAAVHSDLRWRTPQWRGTAKKLKGKKRAEELSDKGLRDMPGGERSAKELGHRCARDIANEVSGARCNIRVC